MFNFYDFDGKFSLKYPGKVPKNYDVSEIQFIFDFIYLVYERHASIDKAIEGVAWEYSLSEDYLRQYLIENRYLLNKSNDEEFLKSAEKYNTKTLKKILKSHGLKASGKRERIIQRIVDNNLIQSEPYLSSKSKVFYRNKKRRNEIFNSLPQEFYYFCEFNDYYMNSFRKKVDNISIDFINMYIDKAVERKDHKMFTINNAVMAEFFLEKDDYKRMLEYVLRIFCINLNPIWKLDELDNHGGMSEDIYRILSFLLYKLGKNRIISTYFVVWDSFNFEKVIVSKYAGYRYLKDVLNHRNLFDIVKELEEKYYSNPELKVRTIIQKTLFDF